MYRIECDIEKSRCESAFACAQPTCNRELVSNYFVDASSRVYSK